MPINTNINTTKAGLKPRLEEAAKKTGESYHAGATLKRAIIVLAADAAGLQGKDRAEFCKLLDSTPGWFGCGNNSACRQAYEKTDSGADAIAADYGKW